MKTIKTTIFKHLALDEYQKEALSYLANEESVIVSAPTGTGKTLIADILSEKYMGEGKSIIYTAPIKALSNQKFREFCGHFGPDNVGIITGDIVINQNAPLLIMTTEIFRNKLRGDIDSMHNVEYIIFDEIHFIDDNKRGTVWEECLLLKPPHMKFLGLSATVPNVDDLANWLYSVKGEEVKIVRHSERAVPLSHSYYIPGMGISNLKTALLWEEDLLNKKTAEGYVSSLDNPAPLHMQVLKELEKGDYPCLYFVFNRAGCFEKAKELAATKQNLPEDKLHEIKKALDTILARFKISRRDLVKFNVFEELFYKGIGVHHAGIMSVVKYAVEKLFEKKLLDVIYCTETFALGINFPAKTVCFDSYSKFDGKEFRNLKQQEYFQMAGRAGRRGIDTEGKAITVLNPKHVMYDGIPRWDENQIEEIGSSFTLSYNGAIHLFEEDPSNSSPELIGNSFAVFLANKEVQRLKEQEKKVKEIMDKCKDAACSFIGTEKCILERNRMIVSVNKKINRLRNNKNSPQMLSLVKEKEMLYRIKSPYCPKRKQKECKKELDIMRAALSEKKELQKRYSSIDRMSTSKILTQNFQQRIKVLDSMGYIDSAAKIVNPRGNTAKSIFVQELLITELLYSGFFEKFDCDAINAVLSCVDFEPRRKDFVNKECASRPLKEAVDFAMNIIEIIENTERYFLDKGTVVFDTLPAEIIYRISRGEELKDVLKITSISDGDIVNIARRTLSLLRQIRDCAKDLPQLLEKVDSCIMCLEKDMFVTVL